MKDGSKAVDAPDYEVHMATVKELWRLDPERAAALITMAEWALKEEQAKGKVVTLEGGQR